MTEQIRNRDTDARADLIATGLAAAILLGLAGWAFWPGEEPAPKTAEERLHDRLSGAATQCMAAVRKRTMFPSEAAFAPDAADMMARIARATPATRTFTYRGRVGLLNAGGNRIPHRYSCTLDIPRWTFTGIDLVPG